MSFQPIDLTAWPRREHYEHFLREAPCSYAATVPLDITPLAGQRLYPAMMWLLCRAIRRLPAFRTALTPQGLGIYEELHPAYTVFDPLSQLFSTLWTAFHPRYEDFRRAYEEDVSRYGGTGKYAAKPGRPPNSFDVSMMPWVPFSAFQLHIAAQTHLLPIFTLGQAEQRDGRRTIPLAIQVHHAVCDGFHLGEFIRILQEEIRLFPTNMG